ncbi:MAG: hypothetical protein JNL28_13240 [Planctomycetes bacterium]|nr:hypothetical protein [Planctomycetota bacterium]
MNRRMWWRNPVPWAVLALSLGTRPANVGELPAAQTGADLRVERFVIYTQRSDASGGVTIDVSGFVELRRRDTTSGPQLECDTRFLVGAPGLESKRNEQRVVQVECPSGRGPRCVWRELGPGTGRSVQADWSADGGALEITEWSPAAKRKGTLVAAAGATMPLYLMELLRGGQLAAGHVVVFDPLALTLAPLEVRTSWLDAAQRMGTEADVREAEAEPREARTVELRRGDGTLAARYRFVGLELVAFQWQEGSMYARRMEDAEFERLQAQHLVAVGGTRGTR